MSMARKRMDRSGGGTPRSVADVQQAIDQSRGGGEPSATGLRLTNYVQIVALDDFAIEMTANGKCQREHRKLSTSHREYLQFAVKGVPHYVAIENVKEDVGRPKMVADLKAMVRAATQSDHKYVGVCPAGTMPGDAMAADEKVIHKGRQ